MDPLPPAPASCPAGGDAPGNLSGIVVTAAPGRIDAVIAALAALPGVEVQGCDRATGRIALVQEAADVGAEVQGYGRIRALPGVLGADLACHYFGGPDGAAADDENEPEHPEMKEPR